MRRWANSGVAAWVWATSTGCLSTCNGVMRPGVMPSRICSSPTCTSTSRSRGPRAREPTSSITWALPGPMRCTRRNTQASTKINPTTSNNPSTNWVSCPPTPLPSAGAAAWATGSAAITLKGSVDNSPTNERFISTQLLDAFARADHVGQADAELLVDHRHFAMGDQRAVDQHVQRLAGQAVQLDHRPLVELQQVADVDFGAADFHGDRHRNVEDHVQVRTVQRHRLVVLRHAAELFHLDAITGGRGGRIGRQQRVDIVLADIAGFFQ